LKLIEVLWAAEVGPECVWVAALARKPGVQAPFRGFGSSDCRAGCDAHLLHLPDTVAPADFCARAIWG
jgi:hypothetical protein